MADVVNLNRARKARDRAAQAAIAAANRVKHGRTLAERQRDAATETSRAALLDGARLAEAAPGTRGDAPKARDDGTQKP